MVSGDGVIGRDAVYLRVIFNDMPLVSHWSRTARPQIYSNCGLLVTRWFGVA